MNVVPDDRSLAQDVALVLAESAPRREPDHLLHSVLFTTGRKRPRPRWLALIKEPPMRLHASIAYGSPVARIAAIALSTLMLIVLAAGTVLAGATLLSNGEHTPRRPLTNGQIAFDSADGNIYVADPDGSHVRVLVDMDNEVRSPSWSPDGTQLAFYEMVDPSDQYEQARAHVVDADGTSDTIITDEPIAPALFTPRLESASGLIWSPDSSQVAMSVRDSTSSAHVLIAQADGSGVRPLPVEIDSIDPMWSPDGTTIVFRGYEGGDSTAIHTWRSSDGRLTPVVGGPPDRHDLYVGDAAFASPQWSPSGDSILYYSYDNTDGRDQDDFSVYVVGADGSDPHEMVENPDDEVWPSWSPDGTQIAFQRWLVDDAGQHLPDAFPELYVMGRDGSDLRQLDVGPRMSGTGPLIWAPDGSALLTVTWDEDEAAGLGRTRPTIVPLDPTTGRTAIPDPGGLRPAGFSGWAGLSWGAARPTS